MGHLNELSTEFAGRGLTILGVTWEAASPTEKWVAQHGVAYPYAYDPGGKLKRELGVGGIPHALLVDPGGVVVWRGHPGGLKKDVVEKALGGALSTPLWDWPEAAEDVAKGLMSRRFDKALAALEELDAESRAALEPQVRRLLDSTRARLESARDEGDWLAVEWRARRLRAEAPDLPEGELAKSLLDELKGDRAKKAIRDAQEDLRELESETDFGKAKKLEKAIKKLEKLRDAHPGTIVEREATERLALWRDVLEKLD